MALNLHPSIIDDHSTKLELVLLEQQQPCGELLLMLQNLSLRRFAALQEALAAALRRSLQHQVPAKGGMCSGRTACRTPSTN